MLRVENLSKIYSKGRNKNFYAIKDINFELKKEETLSIVGNSGSGKSTIAQIIAGISPASEGKVVFKEKNIAYSFPKNLRNKIQIIFQHPESSFNPRLKIIDSLKEAYGKYKKDCTLENIIRDIDSLGLREEFLYRHPRELSGGELQRFSICRALSVSPEILILDEPTSMLDVVSQAQIIKILNDYKIKNQTSYIFITHNRSLSKQFSDRELFIENGKLI